MMTNPDQDVTLDEMARAVVEFMPDDIMKIDDPYDATPVRVDYTNKDYPKNRGYQALYNDLDVIREVEEALPSNLHSDYLNELVKLTEPEQPEVMKTQHDWNIVTADPKTRLQAIYATLRESGDI